MTRDEVLREFRSCRDWCNVDGQITCVDAGCRGRLPDAERMADEIVRLREQLQQHGVKLLQERERLATVAHHSVMQTPGWEGVRCGKCGGYRHTTNDPYRLVSCICKGQEPHVVPDDA